MHHIFYLMGKSASGKDSFYKKLLNNKSFDFKTIVLYSTRPIREGEVDGVTYNFVTDDRFHELEKSGKVIESRSYNVVDGVWTYFTVDDGSVDLKNNDYIIIGTLESYEKMTNYYTSDVMVPIYIDVPNGIRLKRAIAREDKEENPRYKEVCRRFLADEKDFSLENLEKNNISKVFTNIKFSKCYKEIVEYINSFR